MENENIVLGRNSVIELLLSERPIEKIYLFNGCEEKFKKKMYELCSKRRIPLVKADKAKIDSFGKNNQGIVAIAATKEYCEIDDILNFAYSKNEKPFVVIADGINDPHNLGAIIRSAECAGVHGIIIPKRHSVSVTPVVHKSSAGASEHMLIAKVPNLAAAVDELKDKEIYDPEEKHFQVLVFESENIDLNLNDISNSLKFVKSCLKLANLSNVKVIYGGNVTGYGKICISGPLIIVLVI